MCISSDLWQYTENDARRKAIKQNTLFPEHTLFPESRSRSWQQLPNMAVAVCSFWMYVILYGSYIIWQMLPLAFEYVLFGNGH